MLRASPDVASRSASPSRSPTKEDALALPQKSVAKQKLHKILTTASSPVATSVSPWRVAAATHSLASSAHSTPSAVQKFSVHPQKSLHGSPVVGPSTTQSTLQHPGNASPPPSVLQAPSQMNTPGQMLAHSYSSTPSMAPVTFEGKFKANGKSFLTELFALLRTFTQHTNLYVSSTGLSLQFVHCFGQALISVFIDHDSFNSYDCPANMSMLTVGLKVTLLYNYLQIANDDNTIALRVEDERGGIARIYELYMENDDKSRKVLYEIDSVLSADLLSTLPEPIYHAVYKLPAEEFCRICTSLSYISNRVTISAKEKQVTFMASGQDGTVQIGLAQKAKPTGANQSLSIVKFTMPVHQSFELSYLMKFNAASSMSTDVHLYMAVNAPMRIQFDFDKVDAKGFIHFYIAPAENLPN